ncbi:hypothetical protein D6779_08800 [Candidatus Parcubacteria bacterium]|nr:MAG: hypothetical protein D6779_08800 [Candidatus Parcubacteria bacterium]
MKRIYRQDLLNIIVLMLVGGVVYFTPVVVRGMPLGDGGLFYRFIQVILHNEFMMPATVLYNGESLPFAYPPLAFYVAAAFVRMTSFSLLDVFRWLPPVLLLFHIPLFYILTAQIFDAPFFKIGATLLFVTDYLRYEWLLMGGGIARALGYGFALAGGIFLVRFIKKPTMRMLFLASLLGGGVALAHSGTAFAYLLYLEGAIIYVVLKTPRTASRIRTIITYHAMAGGTIALVSMPWWLHVYFSYGLAPLHSALFSGHKGWYVSILQWPFWPYIPLVLSGWILFWASIGLWNPNYRFRGWLFLCVSAAFLLAPRAPLRYSAVCMAWLAQMGIEIPWRHLERHILVRRIFAAWVVTTLVVASVWQAVQIPGLTRNDMAFMMNLKNITVPDNYLLVLPLPAGWGGDFYHEWLPALTELKSPWLVQGSEWNGHSRERIEERERVISVLHQYGMKSLCELLIQKNIKYVWVLDGHPWIADAVASISRVPAKVENDAGWLFSIDIATISCP